jgi:Ran GTPase-activating protein (RanGAP) involved in mRNA processing and transport
VKLLDLSANAITADGIWIMTQKGFCKNTTLEQLNVSDNRISDSGARALAIALESNKSIELLNITGNGISDEGVAVLMSVPFFIEIMSPSVAAVLLPLFFDAFVSL